jgi:adenosylcobinamide-GDP ribazoletransferase
VRSLRLSVGLLTVIPVGAIGDVDRRLAGRAILWAPIVGAVIGTISAGIVWAAHALVPTALGSLLAAALGIGALAYLTRALHLDGLADTADALGSGRQGDEALEIARRSDIGPFGVVTLVLALLIQMASLAIALQAGWGPLAIIVAVVTGRLAAVVICTRGIPAARPDGLGALVAGVVPRWAAAVWALVALGGAAAAGAWFTGSAVAAPLGVGVGLVIALGLVARSVRRFGGITGDVIGAAIETATTVSLLVLALTANVAA